MHIKLISKKLLFNEHKVKCAIGKRGLTKFKKEGDRCTPKGLFTFKNLFYRKDRIKSIKTKLKKIIIKKNMGWCDDPNSKHYNKLIKFPFTKSAEKLYKTSSSYDMFLVINYNLKNIKKNKGSAIFLHIAKGNYKPTEGCIAVSKKDFKLLLQYIKTNTKILIF